MNSVDFDIWESLDSFPIDENKLNKLAERMNYQKFQRVLNRGIFPSTIERLNDNELERYILLIKERGYEADVVPSKKFSNFYDVTIRRSA